MQTSVQLRNIYVLTNPNGTAHLYSELNICIQKKFVRKVDAILSHVCCFFVIGSRDVYLLWEMSKCFSKSSSIKYYSTTNFILIKLCENKIFSYMKINQNGVTGI